MPKAQLQSKSKERVAEKSSVPAASSIGLSKLASSSTTPNTTQRPTFNTSELSHFNSPTMDTPSFASEPLKQPHIDNSKPIPTSDTPPKPQTLTLSTHIGDIFAAPPLTVLIHACNTQGSWGAGIAAAFRARYPVAYTIYRKHCIKDHDPKTNSVPTGTCLLIPPSETKPGASQHWIACLFTSAKYGRAKDKPDVILRNTGPAVKEMFQQLEEAQKGGEEVAGLRMCKINSARFAVPWERTVKVLEGIEIEEDWAGEVEVWDIE